MQNYTGTQWINTVSRPPNATNMDPLTNQLTALQEFQNPLSFPTEWPDRIYIPENECQQLLQRLDQLISGSRVGQQDFNPPNPPSYHRQLTVAST